MCKRAPKDTNENVPSSTIYNSKTQKQPKYLPTAEWINKPRYIYTMGYYTAEIEWTVILHNKKMSLRNKIEQKKPETEECIINDSLT